MKIETALELAALPSGSVVTTPFPDLESNVAEKASDGYWLVTGEGSLYNSVQLADAADTPFKVLRMGYGED